MIAIIKGENRVVMGKVRLKEWESHHYYLSGTQLYPMYPDAMIRVIRTKYGHRINDEEAQAWHENSTIPYHAKRQSYSMDKTISNIMNRQLMTTTRKGYDLAKLAIKNRRSIMQDMAALLPFVLVGLILLRAWL